MVSALQMIVDLESTHLGPNPSLGTILVRDFERSSRRHGIRTLPQIFTHDFFDLVTFECSPTVITIKVYNRSMNSSLQTVTSSLGQHFPALRREFFVDKIGVFGSFVHGDATGKSDIDVLVDLSRPISMFHFLDLEEHLSKILGRKVDLVTTKALKPAIRNEILADVVYV